ncbi:MAG: hypothetical protein AB1397_04685 [bacterium]
MQTNPVSIINGAGSLNSNKRTLQDKGFIKLFQEALGKTKDSPGWEDREEIRVIEKGINQWDIEKDGRIDAKDIKRLFPQKKRIIEKTEAYLGKTDKDPGWEDRVEWVLRRRRWG